MIVYNYQQQLTRLCSFQEDFVLLQSPLRNNGNQGQQAIIWINQSIFYRGQWHGDVAIKMLNMDSETDNQSQLTAFKFEVRSGKHGRTFVWSVTWCRL